MVMAGVAAARFVIPAAGLTILKLYRRFKASRIGSQITPERVLLTGLTIDEIYDSVKEDAPASDEEALRESAHTVARMLGLDGSEVLWPTHSRGENRGMPIEPVYFTMHLPTGRAWYAGSYHSRKSVDAGFRRGRNSARRFARRDMVQTKEIAS